MFTGIITDIGRVRAVARNGDTRMEITTAFDTATIAEGASIACSGVCLTVVETGPGWFAVEASLETTSITTLGDWRPGQAVNLERALRAGDELGGHIVSGHVDGLAVVDAIVPEGDSLRFSIRPPGNLLALVAAKGSVALDGVSLTVNAVSDDCFGVNIIRHTAHQTTFGELSPGRRLNMEIDMLARYVARLLERSED